MPNFDSGTYFLTALAPIDNRNPVLNGSKTSSALHMVRQKLETLPTARQSAATLPINRNSPFARTTKTHFARFIVIDDVAHNGRDGENALWAAVFGHNPIIARPVDRLRRPYLLFVAEFDAGSGEAAARDAYLRALWDSMGVELQEIFQYCWDFPPRADADAFVAYIARCQLETTTPFHDYWEGRPQLGDYPRSPLNLALPILAALAMAGLALWAAGASALVWVPGLAAGGALGAAAAVWRVFRLNRRPFPSPPNATLPQVLKALHLQRAFTRFAIGHQACPPERLHAEFAAFLAQFRPDDLEVETQPPGIIPL